MSRNSITLKADGRTVRCAANKRFAVAIHAGPGKLIVTKRTDSVMVVGAHLRKLARDFPRTTRYAFDLPTGKLFYTSIPGFPVHDDASLVIYARNVLGRP